MKSTKMILTILSLAVAGVFCSSVQAVDNFEFYNKSDKDVVITLKIGNDRRPAFHVPAGYAAQRTVPNNQTILLAIEHKGTGIANIYKKILPTEKTKYISFSPNKKPNAYPQTGPWMGLKGTTESGLPLRNNLSQDYIVDGSVAQWQ